MSRMCDAECYKLLHGPYYPPRVGVGSELFCEIQGYVRCRKWSDGPIVWPRACAPGRNGRPAYVLCGDLIRAVRCEASLAIQHWWGVSESLVSRWRKALGVDQFNEGTLRLYSAHASRVFTPELTNRAVRLAGQQKVRLKATETRRSHGNPGRTDWTDAKKALLGTMSDPQAAKQLDISIGTVCLWRNKFGIPPFQPSRNNSRGVRFVVATDKLMARRLALNLLQKELAARVGMAPATYSLLEVGIQRSTNAFTLHRLAQVLQCKPRDLLS